MGLVVQAPVDALTPIADAPATAAGQTTAETASGDIFASLLASLSMTLEAKAEELGMAPPSLPVAGEPEGDQDAEKEGDPFAALFAMAMPMTVAKLPDTVVALAADGGPAPAITVVDEASPVAPVTVTVELPAVQPTIVPTEAASDLGEVPPVRPRAEAIASVQAPAAEPRTTDVTDVIESPTVRPATSNLVIPVAKEPGRPEPMPGTEAGDAPPPDQSETTSVVRNVGNAKADDGDGGAEGDRGPEKQAIERPQPRASAEGIAHAAANSAVGELRQAREAAAAVEGPFAPDQPATTAEVPRQVDQVASAVMDRVELGDGEARIHLDPAGLGEVTIHVRTDGDDVRVEVRAEKLEAMNLLRDHTRDLQNLLGERGLNLSDVNVGLGRGNGDQAWGQDARPETRPVSGEFASILGIDEGPSIEIHQRLRAAYNPDGAHVYRV